MVREIACPNCDTRYAVPVANWQIPAYSCGVCSEELPPQIGFASLLIEFARFSRNAVLVFGIPFVSAVAFLHYPSFKALTGFVFCLSLTLASVACHEFLHALAAFLLGDKTVYRRGYLRLNPMKYFAGFHSLAFPSIIFVLSGIFLPGAAVFIRFDHIRHPLARSLVYLAGVAANGIFLVAILTVLRSGAVTQDSDFAALLQFAAFCQICIIAFNLLPVPGLDGWGVIAPIFANGVQKLMDVLSPLIILLFAVTLVSSEAVNRNYAGTIADISARSGLQFEAVVSGKSYAMIVDAEGCRICAELRAIASNIQEWKPAPKDPSPHLDQLVGFSR